jgi:serine/threonine protein kinase
MEYVHGSSLGDLLDDGRTFSVGEIARIGLQTALGLAAAHEARLIHRDIKPANILLEKETLHVRVADFGLARALDEDFHLSQPGLLLGTPNYMSPEQVDGKTLTAASDLFSLGSVLYTLCTGQLPFQSETMSGLLHAVAEKHPTPLRVLNPDIPEELARVIEKLHAKYPTDRPLSAAAVAESLRPWSALRT